MKTINLNKKRMSVKLQRLLIFMAAVMLATMTFTACGDDEGGGNSGKGKVWVDKKGGKTQTFANLDAAFLPILQSGPGEYTVRIGENQHITSNFNFFTSKDQKITLKAESGTVEITRSSDLLHHFSVSLESTLIIDKGIILKGSGDDYYYNDYAIFVDLKGKLIMNEGAKLTNFGGSAIFLCRDAFFEMNGGIICDNINWGVSTDNEWDGQVFIMNGGTISDNGNNSGSGTSGVHIGQGTFTMNDGLISGNKAGGVVVYNNGGKFIMKKGRIINNRIKYYGSSGGGVGILYGTFIMDGGEISGNEATDGGGVSVVHASFIMNGGTISGNKAESWGGGVFVAGDNSSFTMNGGVIAGNTSERFGGGGVGLYSEATFTKTGKSIIYGENGGTNANKTLTGTGHAAHVNTVPYSTKRDLTAGEGVVMRWGANGNTKEGWDN